MSGHGGDRAGYGLFIRTLLATGLLGLAAPAAAQATDRQTGAWQYELTPYLWAAAIKGDVQAAALPKIGVDLSFSDIWHDLDFGLMGAFEARKGPWGMLFDAIYMKISTSATATRTGPGPIGATATATANLTMEQTMLSAAVAYRVAEGVTATDVFGGLRYNKIEANADINGSLFALSRTVSRSGDKGWVDPYVGLRIQHPIVARWTLIGYGDIGGFGLGSDFTWQVAVGARYDFSKTISGKFGYRYLSVDYDKSAFLYDMSNNGLYAGIGIRF